MKHIIGLLVAVTAFAATAETLNVEMSLPAVIATLLLGAVIAALRYAMWIWDDPDQGWPELRDSLCDWQVQARELARYPHKSGVLADSASGWEVDAFAMENGLVLRRSGYGTLSVGWNRIRSIQRLDDATARIKIARKTAGGVYYEVPWSAEFERFVPDELAADRG